jgi:hypothetical protein
VEVLAQRVPQRGGVRVRGRHEAARLEPRELQHAPPGVDRASRLMRVQADELGLVVGAERAQRTSVRAPGAQVLKAVLGDRVAVALALHQPAHHLR